MRSLPQPILDALEAADVPPLPQVLLRLLQAMESDGVSMGELAAIVDKDPALVARVLAAANSAAFRRARPVVSIEACLQTLGIRVVKSIATCLAVKRLFDDQSRSWHADLSGFWRHSLLTADIARALALRCGFQRPDEAYLAGLLHDVGELLMFSALRERYGRLVAVSDSEDSLVQLETLQLGAAHSDVGAWLIDQWHLDTDLADSVLFHHESHDRIVTAEMLPRLVWLANACAANRHPAEDLAAWGSSLCAVDAAGLELIRTDAYQRMRLLATAMDVPVLPEDQPVPGDDCLPKGEIREPDAPGDAGLHAAVAGRALLQPLQEAFQDAASEGELLLALREAARILFGVGRVAFLLVDPTRGTLRGAPLEGQPAVFGNFEQPLAEPRCLAAHALLGGTPRSSFDGIKLGALSLADIQFARALGSEGLLCLPLGAGGTGLGVLVLGLNSGQYDRLAKRAEWLKNFALVAAAAIRSQRDARQREAAVAAAVADRHGREARRLAHEVGNPLTIIRSYLKLLDGKLPADLEARAELTVLREEIDRVGALVQRLGATNAGQAPPPGVELNTLIRELATLYGEPLFRSRRIDLALDLDPRDLLVRGDRDAVKQIVVNLLKNAAEALAEGGRVAIESRAGIALDGRIWHELSIDDNGPGLSGESVDRLYGAEPAVANGRGLGLSIVGSLADQLGARLVCRARPGQGTRISILLPAEAAVVGAYAGEG